MGRCAWPHQVMSSGLRWQEGAARLQIQWITWMSCLELWSGSSAFSAGFPMTPVSLHGWARCMPGTPCHLQGLSNVVTQLQAKHDLKDRSRFPNFCSCWGINVLGMPAAWNSAGTTTMADGTACFRDDHCIWSVRLQDPYCQIADTSRAPVFEHAGRQSYAGEQSKHCPDASVPRRLPGHQCLIEQAICNSFKAQLDDFGKLLCSLSHGSSAAESFPDHDWCRCGVPNPCKKLANLGRFPCSEHPPCFAGLVMSQRPGGTTAKRIGYTQVTLALCPGWALTTSVPR